MMRRVGFRGRRRQVGAIGLLGAMVMLLVVLCIALALDTGRLYMEKRNLQRVADLAALEVASQVEDGIYQAPDDQLTDLAVSAAGRNGHEVDGTGREIQATGGGLCRKTVGLGESAGYVREFQVMSVGETALCADGAEPLRRTAVRILAERETAASLFGSLLGEGSVTLRAQATARPSPKQPVITFSLGSRLLEADGSGLLGELLGSGLNVTALGYEGLANATLSVADLIELAAGAGTANGLLQDVDLDLANLARIDELNALARHPEGEQNALSAGVSLFSDALDEFIGLGLEAVRLGEIINLDPSGGDDALQAEVGLLSLLETMAFVGNGRFLDLDSLGLDLGILGGVDLALEVIEPPQIAVGRSGCDMAAPPCNGQWQTQAHTGQVTLGARVQVGVPLVAGLDVLVGVRAVSARAGIDDVETLGEGDDAYRLTAGAYHRPLGVDLSVGLALLSGSTGLSDWLAERDFDDGGGSRMSPSPGLIEWPSEAAREFSSESAGDLTEALLDEAGSLNVVVTLAGLPIVIPADMLLGALEPVLTQLVASVLDPVLELLGLNVGAADMRIIEVEAGEGGAELVI